MTAEIVTVGTELLMGQILNTNAQWLSGRCVEFGFDLYHQTTVGDNPARMRETIAQAFSRADVVITTGGLGPTQDDVTKEAVAEVLGLKMVENEDVKHSIHQYFCDIHRELTQNNYRQASFPEQAIILKNDNGTAPGCICEKDGKAVIVLPGPPGEMRPMFDVYAAPYLERRINAVLHSETLHIFGMGESAVEQGMLDLVKSQTNPTIATYCSMGDVMIRVTAKAKDADEAANIARPVADELFRRFENNVYSRGDSAMGKTVIERLIKSKSTIAVAESCTGGLIADMLVTNPGASSVFLEGCVTYSNDAKISRLGVSAETLARYGAVSEQTAREMAEGMKRTSGADYALATTGIAGPDGGSDEKPVGLVYVALASETGVAVQRLELGKSRERVRKMAALSALDMVRNNISR